MRHPTPPTTPVPVVKKPTVVVAEVKPEPVPMRHPTPPTTPVPVVKKPAVVVAEVEPEPVPMRHPTPPTTPVPVVKKPAVVVAEVKPEPVPMRHPTPPTTPVPVVKKPAAVVAEVKPDSSPKSEPDKKDDYLKSLLASIDKVDGSSDVPVDAPDPVKADDPLKPLVAAMDKGGGRSEAEATDPGVKEESEMGLLLASLGSHGSENSEPILVATQEPDDLAAYVLQLAEIQVPEVEPETVEAEISVLVQSVINDGPARYVTSSKSANILEELLTKDKSKTSASLGLFLDGLVEDINDKR